MTIINYRIVNGSKNRPLAEQVKFQLESGWQPYHSPYIDNTGIEKQAMVMYEEEPAEIMSIPRMDQYEPKNKSKKKAVKDEH